MVNMNWVGQNNLPHLIMRRPLTEVIRLKCINLDNLPNIKQLKAR